MELRNVVVLCAIVTYAGAVAGATLSGRVTDCVNTNVDVNGIEGVDISIVRSGKQPKVIATTDAAGHYTLTGLRKGNVRLIFDKPRWERNPPEETVDLRATSIFNVEMIRTVAPVAYYAAAADAMRAADPTRRAKYELLIAVLPATNRAEVLRALNKNPLPDKSPVHTASLTGFVELDDFGLPGATVTLAPATACAPCPETCACAPTARTEVTNGDGSYVFRAIAPGEYIIRTELSGLRTATRHATVSSAGETAVAPTVPMVIAAVTEAITVTADAPLLTVTGVEPNQPLIVVSKECGYAGICPEPTAVITRSDGTYTTHLPTGTYDLVVPRRDGSAETTSIDLSAARSITLDLRPPNEQ